MRHTRFIVKPGMHREADLRSLLASFSSFVLASLASRSSSSPLEPSPPSPCSPGLSSGLGRDALRLALACAAFARLPSAAFSARLLANSSSCRSIVLSLYGRPPFEPCCGTTLWSMGAAMS